MESVVSSSPLLLEENLNITAVSALVETLKSSAARSVSMDASDVKHLDWPVVQVLLAAAAQWKANKLNFDISNVSESFQFGLDTLGIDLKAITSVEPI